MRFAIVAAVVAVLGTSGCVGEPETADPEAEDRGAGHGGGAGSDAGSKGASGGGGGGAWDGGGCVGPLGPPQDPASLPACCEDHPGRAHCVPGEKVPAILGGVLAKCDKGGVCVPDEFIKTGGVFKPKSCKSIGGAEGVCLSMCVPEVQAKSALLPQDACGEDERCVPCISPIDNKPTGACLIEGKCAGDEGGAGSGGNSADAASGEKPCPHVGPPVVDPKTFPACQCAGAHCVPKIVVPPAFASKLADCQGDPGGKCVPDSLIASGGDFVPPTCKSVLGREGRCLSACLPDVAAQGAQIPQSTCAAGDKCVPCYSPLDLKDTGACRLSCDPGPKEPPPAPLPKCCSNRGTCVPKASVPPQSAGNLQKDKCPTDEYLCAPDVFLQKTWKKIDCQASLLFLGPAGPGVCMPECVKGMSFLLEKAGCPDGMKCAPCKDPLSGKPTGACEFQP